MKTLFLSRHDLQDLILAAGIDALMDELIARLTEAIATFDPETTRIPARTGFDYSHPASGLIEWMPLHDHGSVLMKIVGYHPNSPAAHGLPTILSTFSRYDTRTGHLQAICDGTFLTALRTGAASAVATRLLARPDARTIGLIGCGAQAVTQLHAIRRCFPLDEVLIHDTDPAALETFPSRVAAFTEDTGIIRVVERDEVVTRSDILCVATTVAVGAGPVFSALPMRPGAHINAVGSDFPGKFEVPKAILDASLVCVDSLEQARVEGECQQLATLDDVVTLTDIARRPRDFEDARMRPTLFDSTGWALEDRVVMDMVLERAHATGAGSAIELESITDDPRHPYEFLAALTPRNRP